MARRPALAASALMLGGVLVLGTPEPAAAGGDKSQGLGNPISPKTVFVTSQVYDGNLGGLRGADQKCQSLATAAHLKGLYEAWLSDTVSPTPSTRFVHGKGPYELVDGTVVANNWADLTDGTLQHPIDMDENKNTLNVTGPVLGVWTGTSLDETAPFNGIYVVDCYFWSLSAAPPKHPLFGIFGLLNQSDASWTNSGVIAPCTFASLHLYCFQQ